MTLFDIAPRNIDKSTDVAIAKKSKKVSDAPKPVHKGIIALVEQARENIETKLAEYKDESIIISTREELHRYVDKCIANNYVSIDTETTGKDAFRDKIVGMSMYTRNEKPCYIPINHISYITNERVANQLSENDIKEEISRLNGIDIDMFNAPFDVKIFKYNCDFDIVCTWDGYLGMRLLDENNKDNALKSIYAKYVLKGEDAFSFSDLFDTGNIFRFLPVDLAKVYAGHDAIVTTAVCDYQRQFLSLDNERKDFRELAKVMINQEMRLEPYVIEMEETGVALDLDYCEKLSRKYHQLLEEKESEYYAEVDKYKELIEEYKKTHRDKKIDVKMSYSSPAQLKIFFYEILKVGVIDKKNPEGTGEDILAKIDLPIAKKILECRGLSKLIGTYIDKMPKVAINGRVHCKFNQYGTDTGRFSSSEPNLQNIPSENHEIRPMFKATDGYVMMSSDFSQQEPKALAALCKIDGDSQMYDVFMQGKDLYSEIASKAFHETYLECLEHFPKDTPIIQRNGKWYYATLEQYDKLADGENDVYEDGSKRRKKAKSILLGVLYGRGEASIAEQLKCSIDEAHNIKQSVFKAFPAIAKFEKDSIDMSIAKGYVTTITSRKRRLPSMMLPDYEVIYDKATANNDPLDFDNNTTNEVPYDVQEYWIRKVRASRFKKSVYEEANRAGLWIIDNTKDKDVTKVVNARIQGSASDLTKVAMIGLAENKRLRELGFRMLIQVHDELIVECPKENMVECKQLLADTMSKAAEKLLGMPIKCDVEVTDCWYGKEEKDEVEQE